MNTIHDNYAYNKKDKRWEGPEGFVLKSTHRKTFAAVTNDGIYLGGDFVGFEDATMALHVAAGEIDESEATAEEEADLGVVDLEADCGV